MCILCLTTDLCRMQASAERCSCNVKSGCCHNMSSVIVIIGTSEAFVAAVNAVLMRFWLERCGSSSVCPVRGCGMPWRYFSDHCHLDKCALYALYRCVKVVILCDVDRVWRFWISVGKDRDWDKDQSWGWGEQSKIHASESLCHCNKDTIQWCACLWLHKTSV